MIAVDVLLRCRACGTVTRVAASTRDYPRCVKCGGEEFAIAELAPERVDRALDDDAWKNSYDDWKTGGGRYH